MGDQILKKVRALFEINGVRIPIEEESPFLQVRRQPAPGRGLPPETGQVDFAGHTLALSAGDGGYFPEAELFDLMRSAPQAEQNHAGHRHSQQQAHPHQLIGGTAGTLIYPDGHRRSGDQQQSVDKAGVFRQEE